MANGIPVEQLHFAIVSIDENLGFFSFRLAGAESLGGTVSSGTAQKIRKEVETLEEENNMLKLKLEVLLNLVAESAAELSDARR